MKRIVLAHSGGAATLAAIRWLVEHHGGEVITLTLDLGQERELSAVRERALALGAVRAHVIDAREELARDFIRPALQAGALGSADAPPPSALGLPLIARRLLEIARMESAKAVAHGGEPGTLPYMALRAALESLAAGIELIGPQRDWQAGQRAPRLRTDANIWGRVLHAPGEDVPDDAFTLTRAAAEAPDTPAFVEIAFARGVPVSANGIDMPLMELIESLETIAGAHGVGRRHVTAGVLGACACEAPAAAVLGVAQRDLELAVLGADLADMKQQLGSLYASLIASGRWFSDIREAIDGFSGVLQPRITGTVRVKLHKGECTVVERYSPHAAANPRAVA